MPHSMSHGNDWYLSLVLHRMAVRSMNMSLACCDTDQQYSSTTLLPPHLHTASTQQNHINSPISKVHLYLPPYLATSKLWSNNADNRPPMSCWPPTVKHKQTEGEDSPTRPACRTARDQMVDCQILAAVRATLSRTCWPTSRPLTDSIRPHWDGVGSKRKLRTR